MGFGITSTGVPELAPLLTTYDLGRLALFCHWKNENDKNLTSKGHNEN